jgi:hypothetical protein
MVTWCFALIFAPLRRFFISLTKVKSTPGAASRHAS